jgi:hypothetical protein
MSPTTLLLALLLGAAPSSTPLPIPDGTGGIGFDDLLYVKSLDRVLVPAGRTGRLVLVDPATRALTSIGGFSTSASAGGHGAGTTSADAGDGLIYASDRNRKAVAVVDPGTKAILETTQLGAGPDYVRWVGPTKEVWVTEPQGKRIEIFKRQTGSGPRLVAAGSMAVNDGPESLVVDEKRGRAYTHTWHDETIALDLQTHRAVARWKNGCKGSRGIALDEARGFLFVGCDEGKAVVLDVAHDGKVLGTATSGNGVDIIAYAPGLKHLYLPGGDSATMAILAVADSGALTVLRTVPTAADAHCVAADATGGVYVCDPKQGRLLVFKDDAGR